MSVFLEGASRAHIESRFAQEILKIALVTLLYTGEQCLSQKRLSTLEMRF